MKKKLAIAGILALSILLIAGLLPGLALASTGNLILNPGFESWTAGVPDNWVIWNGEIGQATGTDVHSGNYALIVGGYYTWSRVYQDVGIIPGGTYTLSIWQKYPGPSAYTRPEIWWLRADKSIISSWTVNNYRLSSVYEYFEWGPFTAPSGAAFARIAFVKPGWGLLYVDDVSFVGPRPPIPATNDIDPNTLDLKSQSDKNAITAYIELLAGYDVRQIDVATVKMDVYGYTVAAQLTPTAVGDYDNDGVLDLMVKFERQAVITALTGKMGDVALTVSGQLTDGNCFTGTDTIRVINPESKAIIYL